MTECARFLLSVFLGSVVCAILFMSPYLLMGLDKIAFRYSYWGRMMRPQYGLGVVLVSVLWGVGFWAAVPLRVTVIACNTNTPPVVTKVACR